MGHPDIDAAQGAFDTDCCPKCGGTRFKSAVTSTQTITFDDSKGYVDWETDAEEYLYLACLGCGWRKGDEDEPYRGVTLNVPLQRMRLSADKPTRCPTCHALTHNLYLFADTFDAAEESFRAGKGECAECVAAKLAAA